MLEIITCKNNINILVGTNIPIVIIIYCFGIKCIKAIKPQATNPSQETGFVLPLKLSKYSCILIAAIIANNTSIKYMFPNTSITITIGNPITVVNIRFKFIYYFIVII